MLKSEGPTREAGAESQAANPNGHPAHPDHLDITAEVCPMTYVRTKLKLETLPDGALLAVLLKGSEPLKNIPRSAREEGHEVISLEPLEGGVHRLILRKVG